MAADFDRAKHFALDWLQRLPPSLYYHDVRHTRDVVVPTTAELAKTEGVKGEDLLLLLTAAWYHDLGYAETRAGHELAGARLAGEVLPDFGYAPMQLTQIQALILSSEPSHPPKDHLGRILVDADLDTLGRPDFPDWSNRLYRELIAHGDALSALEWTRRQRDFLARHSYFTSAAKARRSAGLAKNLKYLQDMLLSEGNPNS